MPRRVESRARARALSVGGRMGLALTRTHGGDTREKGWSPFIQSASEVERLALARLGFKKDHERAKQEPTAHSSPVAVQNYWHGKLAPLKR